MTLSRSVILVALLLPAAALATPTDPVHLLRQEVAALQIDHALDLTQQQARALLPMLQTARERVQALRAQREATRPALVAALTQAVADLKTTGVVSPSTQQAMEAAQGVAPGEARQDLKAIFQQARQVLTPAQIQALRSAKLGIQPPPMDEGHEVARTKDGPHPGRRFLMMQVLLSDSFVALVQARAA
jgi:hypothetical protein